MFHVTLIHQGKRDIFSRSPCTLLAMVKGDPKTLTTHILDGLPYWRKQSRTKVTKFLRGD